MRLNNAIMWWHNGTTYVKVSDHNRSPLAIDPERIERKARMADGTLRRYTVAKKNVYSCSWEMLPSKNTGTNTVKTFDGGLSGEEMEAFYTATDNQFNMRLHRGDGTTEIVTVMITEFSKEIVKRGTVDFWNLSITLEQV